MFSVLMSVYRKDNPAHLKIALESIFEKQTLKPNEIILVKDGPLTIELDMTIAKWEYKNKHKVKIKTIELSKNVGLGEALKIGLEQCSYDIVARMDSDDIAIKTRFEEQLKFIKSNPTIDIVGGGIDEFLDSIDEIVSHKSVPTQHDEIVKMAKRRKS